MTNEEYEELEMILNCAKENGKKCTQWERDFIDDMFTRFSQYEHNTRVSEKQWKVLRKIYDACQD